MILKNVNYTDNQTDVGINVGINETQEKIKSLMIKNPAIAEGTVRYHASNIYSKVGVSSRTELTNLILKKQDMSS